MNSFSGVEPERVFASLLLREIGVWEEQYKNKIKNKTPKINEEELREKVMNASSRKFKEKFNKVVVIKILKLRNIQNQKTIRK